MPTLTIKFELPGEQCEADIAFHAMGFALSCLYMDNTLRDYIKYSCHFKTIDEAIQGIRDSLHNTLDKHGVSLDMIE